LCGHWPQEIFSWPKEPARYLFLSQSTIKIKKSHYPIRWRLNIFKQYFKEFNVISLLALKNIMYKHPSLIYSINAGFSQITFSDLNFLNIFLEWFDMKNYYCNLIFYGYISWSIIYQYFSLFWSDYIFLKNKWYIMFYQISFCIVIQYLFKKNKS